MESNFLYNLVFAGIFQGLFLSLFILGSTKSKSRASVYLGLLILSITLTNLQYTLDELDLISWDLFNMVYLPYLFLIPPLLYFFVMTFLYPDRSIKKIERLLYLPVIIFLGIAVIYKIIAISSGKTSLNNLNQEKLADFIDIYGDFINIPIILVTIIFLFVAIKKYSKTTYQSGSKIVENKLLWIKVFLGVLFFTLIPWFIYTYLYWKNESVGYMPIFIITSFVIYIFGYIGIHKINVLNQRKKIRSYINESHNNPVNNNQKNGHIVTLNEIIIRNQRYLDPNISLDVLSEELQLSKSHLSRIINTELQMSFSDYINSLRVSEAKKLLLNPEFSNYTLVSIGLEAGFNSKTTFNTTFKKFTYQTPSQFRKNPSN